MDLTDKVVLITGAARRVGAAITRELARSGARICLHYYTSSAEASALADALRARGSEVLVLQADLRNPSEIDALFESIDARFGRLDVLVNNASQYARRPVESTSLEDWEGVFRINLTAPFLCVRHAVRLMKTLDQAVIVSIADLAGERGWPNHVAYSSAKAGLISLTRVLAVELAPRIRVNAVCPGMVILPEKMSPEVQARLMDRIPLGRVGTPEAVARAVRFLIEEDYATGEVLRVDGGRGVRP